MNLLVVSDLHGDKRILDLVPSTILKKIDEIIVCGDLTHYGDLHQVHSMIDDLTRRGRSVLFVPGNCDPKKLATLPSVKSAINLHGTCEHRGTFDFMGVGGSTPGPFNTPLELSEEKIAQLLNKARSKTTSRFPVIVVSHSPPVNTQVDLTSFGMHVGSRALRQFIEVEKPLLVLCGHIHEARGIDMIDTVKIVNPGPAHLGFYALVDIDEGSGVVQVNLESL
ncbi:MAG: metallophosphoesterase family protein [Candidatus Bathyarchaeota archaeon]|nr:MAG: metallophosphoesterase family protein [Candidatus Bathyarchaeota archaeon]